METSEKPTGVEMMNARKFRIPGDVVNKATEKMSDENRSAIRWLHAYASEQNISLADLGAKVRYDESTLYRVFHGKYEGNLDNVCEEIEQFRKLSEQRSTIKKLEFIETALSAKIWKLCEAALTYQRLVMIYGNSQVGKTTALMAYQREHNHGQTIYCRMPEGGALSQFLESMAIALRISPEQKLKELRRRILNSIDDRMLLIVDEVHQTFNHRCSAWGIRPLEFIREIYDIKKCGVVLCGTNVMRKEFEEGQHRQMLLQLRNRSIASLQLPNEATKRDLDAIAAAYGMKPAEGDALRIQTDTIHESGLGKWIIYLQAGSRIAAKRKEQLDWSHIVQAHAAIKSLERKPE